MDSQEVTVPDLGEAADEAELVAWLIAPGDRVAADQPVAEVETDKATAEVYAPAAGVVTELRAAEGDTVAEGATVAVVDTDKAGPDAGGTADESDAGGRRVFAPPRVRRIARERGVDLDDVEGSGTGGRITESDVRAAAERGASSPPDSPGPRSLSGGKQVVTARDASANDGSTVTDDESGPTPRSFSGGKPVVRKPPASAETADRATAEPADEAATGTAAEGAPAGTTAERAPTPPSTAGARRTTHHDEVDVTDLLSVRERLAESPEVEDVTFTALPLAVAAVTRALRRVPELNESVEDERRELAGNVNVAVGVPTSDGLRRPVVVDADEARLTALARELDDLVERAREDRLHDTETADATFTVTDFGALGGAYAVPDLEAAGTAVLALGSIRTLPRVHGGEIVPRDVVTLSTAVDARAVDGAVAARFTNEVRRYLNTPELLLLE